jgi:pyruvoyl-dependent arginine decarboxylase (PvlArgDC)
MNKDKVVNLSMSKRIHAGKCLTCFEAGLYLASQTALLVATAVLLWHSKEGSLSGDLKDRYSKVCNDKWERDEINGHSYPKYENAPDCNSYVDVYY